MLEDELKKIWDSAGWINVSYWSGDLARNDYEISVSQCVAEGVYKRMATLFREHLLEALSSPYPYIREWGKLTMEENTSLARRSKNM